MFSGPVRLTPCPSFETLITNVLPTSLCLLSIILIYRGPYIRKISKSISNTSARTDAHRHLGHLAAIAPSLHVRPLRPTPFTCRVLPPLRRCCCATMSQATVVTNGTKSSTSDSDRASPAASTPAAGIKRKHATEPKFYGVREGRKPGIYNTWEECLSQVTGHKGASCRCLWPVGTGSVAELADNP
jgi:hypothetical protein